MSRKGNGWDNACVESFFGTLKRELVYHRHYATREDKRPDILESIEVLSNRRRVTRPSAMTLRPSTKRERRWLNPVSTELGEGQY